MRIRNIALCALCVVLGGGGFYLFSSGTKGLPVGASGLPLIKADTTPVKVAPEEPASEIMPNSDSTVFTAMGKATQTDPSMQNIKTPAPDEETEEKTTGDFAGFRTGFSLPKPGERKVESLFSKDDAAVIQAPEEAPAASTDNKYYSGMAPEAVGGTPHPEEDTSELAQAIAQTQEPEAEEISVAPQAEAPKPAPEPEAVKPVQEKVEAAPAPEINNTPMSSGQITARMMEAEEKGLAQIKPEAAPAPAVKTPAAKPKPPKLDPIQKPSASETPAPTPQAPPAGPDSKSYYIQLASAPASSDTAGKWGRMVSKYPVLLGDLKPVYQPVNIPGKGDYVRIQAGPMTQAEATKRCAALRDVEPKGGCLVIRR